MKRKSNPGVRSGTNAPKRDVAAEKIVARSMTKLFVVVVIIIVALLVYLWAIGKFG